MTAALAKALLPLLMVGAASSPGPAGGQQKAPDGRRGLGADTPLQDILRVVKTTKDDGRDFVAELLALEPDIRARLDQLLDVYAARGYFDLLEKDAEPTLEALYGGFREAESHAAHALSRQGDASKAFARMFLDTRFRARMEISAGWEVEAREVAAGLWVLRGMTDGYVVLTQEEASHVAVRVDLSASLLRALRTDLGALQPVDDFSVDPSSVTALFARASAADESARSAALAQADDAARAMTERMIGALFTGRLMAESDVVQLLDWRARLWAQTAPVREEALQFLPNTPEGLAAPENIGAMKKHERMRWAGWRGAEGVALDPLDEVLVYVSAHATDFLWGTIQAREYYDRYLALRKIRAHDHKTIRDRDLTEWEREALSAVQRQVLPQRQDVGAGR